MKLLIAPARPFSPSMKFRLIETQGRGFVLLFVTLAVLLILFNPPVVGQTTSTISGVVADETGGVLPGVEITIRHVETRRTRTVVSDDEGRYSVPGLVVGSYEVQAELSGFQRATRRGITLTLSGAAIVDSMMKVGAITEEVIVSGRAPLVNTTSAGIANLVEQQQIADLPLNGRSFADLAALDASVTSFRNALSTASVGTTFGGTGVRLVIAGLRPELGNILVDGLDAIDAFGNAPGSAAGVLLGVDTVREFEVLSSNYSAAFGRAAGGTINTVTRSGTNEFHGSVFEFFRNDNLDARNFFDTDDKPEFNRNQFGFTLGGPIVEDRTFFFASYEGLRDRLGTTLRRKTLTEAARSGTLPSGPVTISPDTLPFLTTQLFPVANGRDFGDGTAEFIFGDNLPTDEDFFVVKVDHYFNDQHSMFVRYSLDDAETIFSPTGLPPERPARDSHQQLAIVEYRVVLTQRLLSTSRIGYNRSTFVGLRHPQPGILPELSLFEGDNRGVGGIQTGVTSRAGGLGGTGKTVQNQYQFNEDLVYLAGAHALKFGFVFKRFQYNDSRFSLHGGDFSFGGLSAFLTGRLWSPASPGIFVGSVPDSDFATHQRFSVLGGYLQDDWKVSSQLTLNLGVRYEVMTTPFNETGVALTLKDPLRDPFWADQPGMFSDKPIQNPGKQNFAPRLGFAWDPSGSGKTAIRGGFGLFFQQLNEANLNFVFRLTPPKQKTLIIGGPSGNSAFPKVPLALQGGFGRLVFPLEHDAKMPYTAQWNLSIQQELTEGLVAQVAYLGNRGIHLARPTALNFKKRQCVSNGVPVDLPAGEFSCPAGQQAFFPSGPPVRNNPNYLGLNLRDFGGDSSYHGFTASLRKRFSAGNQFQISYAFSRTIDNTPPILRDLQNSPTITFDWFQPHLDRGLSAFDVRHNFVGSFGYELPLGPGRALASDATGFAGKFLEGWQVNGIVTLAAGNPFTVENSYDRTGTAAIGPFRHDRPNLASGASNNPKLESPDEWFDVTAFELQPTGFLGNVGRNTVIGPGLANFDFSLFKTTSLSEQADLQFRFEMFNVFNRANFSTPERGNRFAFIPSGVNGSAGRITTTVTTARQIQFALKLLF